MELEKLCPHCEDKWDHKHWCEECKGVGYVPTADGEKLLNFLLRRRFVQAREP